MTGGLMQLVAYGAEDLFLTGNPQITFFKVVYRRHTNFSMEYIRQYFIVKPNLSTTLYSKATVKIERNADLVNDIYLVIDLPNIYSSSLENFGWTPSLGQAFINSAELLVGGQIIDTQYGQWLNIWSQLSQDRSKQLQYNRLINNTVQYVVPNPYYGALSEKIQGPDSPVPGEPIYPTINKSRIYLPLNFWFCGNSGLALPLIALQYTEVTVNIEFAPLNNIFAMGNPAISPKELFYPTVKHSKFNDELFKSLRDGSQGAVWDFTNIFWKFVNGTTLPGVISGDIGWNQNIYIDANFIYLDEDERKRFALTVNEYLITQVQRNIFRGLTGPNTTVELNMHHPIEELIWVFQRDNVDAINSWFNYSNVPGISDPTALYRGFAFDIIDKFSYYTYLMMETSAIPTESIYKSLGPIFISNGLTITDFWKSLNKHGPNYLPSSSLDAFDNYVNIMYTATIKFNGHDRNEIRDEKFYSTLENYRYHTGAPDMASTIYIYSFGTKPEEVQPSGSCNFSRINKVEIQFQLRDTTEEDYTYILYAYSRNYNVFRIMAGIGGLVFSP
jgi:hypothetical protein